MKCELTLKDLKELITSDKEQKNSNDSVLIDKKVIVRSRDAGVMYGTLKKVKGRYVLLENARIIWRWRNKNGGVALNDTAQEGLIDDDYSKLSNFNKTLEMLEACSIIETTEEAQRSLDNREPYKKD